MRLRSVAGRRRLALITGLAVLGATATSLAAQAEAANPAWRVEKFHMGATDPAVNGVVAVSAKEGWAFGGTSYSRLDRNHPLMYRWKGRYWRRFSEIPSGLRGRLNSGDQSSASNVWAIGGDDWEHSFALRWNGKKWSVARKWTGGQVTDVAAFSSKDVWVFGASGVAPGVGTWHYNGTSWTEVAAPFEPARAGKLSSRSIWAIGRGADRDAQTVGHWNGKRWSVVDTGSAIPPDIDQPGNVQAVLLEGIVARSAKDVWLSGQVYRKQSGGPSTKTPLLVHYDGKSWKRARTPFGGSIPDVVSDGRGGLWFAGSFKGRGVLRHRSSVGKWTTAKVIDLGANYAIFNDLALIPGTTRLFGAGVLRAKKGSYMSGVMFYRS